MEDETKKPEEEPEEEEEEKKKINSGNLIDQAGEAAKRLEEANKESLRILQRQEELAARNLLGGQSEAGAQAPKPKKLTDTEYAEALQRGEVNPLKEDGFIK